VTDAENLVPNRPLDPVTDVEKLVPSWLTLPDIAEMLDIEVTRVRQLVRDRQVIALRRGENNALMVPEAFLQNRQVLKGLPGTLTLLQDASYSDEEAVRWLFTSDDTLPGSPVDALVGNRGTEVRRRAQALGF
jgi:Rv2175c C-terminal domain of unknown function